MCGFLKPIKPKQTIKEYTSLPENEYRDLYEKIQAVLLQHSPIIITQNDRKIIQWIYKVTEQHNVNNLTRTKAYLRFFNEHKEIHWAFLAHMVSRNGGYNMTDLKSSLIGKFVDDKQRESLFDFLERANALIFHDAYPQRLLYEISKREKKSFFHLLPAFQITKFMIPIWDHSLLSGNSVLLTFALITNEQHYVENHLMKLTTTKNTIFNTLSYFIQEKMGFTHVIFPYKRYPFLTHYSLAGIEVHDFSSVHERIVIGKQLYSILFSKLRFDSIWNFANQVIHTASRSDYWPQVYSKELGHNRKIYSPSLTDAWKDVSHQFSPKKDWFTVISQIKDFEKGITIEDADITKEIKRDIKMLSAIGKLTV